MQWAKADPDFEVNKELSSDPGSVAHLLWSKVTPPPELQVLHLQNGMAIPFRKGDAVQPRAPTWTVKSDSRRTQTRPPRPHLPWGTFRKTLNSLWLSLQISSRDQRWPPTVRTHPHPLCTIPMQANPVASKLPAPIILCLRDFCVTSTLGWPVGQVGGARS